MGDSLIYRNLKYNETYIKLDPLILVTNPQKLHKWHYQKQMFTKLILSDQVSI